VIRPATRKRGMHGSAIVFGHQSGGVLQRFMYIPIANQVLPLLHKVEETTIYQYLHFSNYGALQARMRREADAIARLRTESPHLLPCSLCAEHHDAAHPDDWLGRIGPDREPH